MWCKWRLELQEAGAAEALPPIKKKIFKAKFPGLPHLSDYRVPAPEAYWRLFPSNLLCPTKATVNAEAFKQLADTLGCSDWDRLARVLHRCQRSAEIGCNGEFRMPSRSSNSSNAYEFGLEISDAIASWISKGYAYGPVLPSEVPGSAKISGIMTRVKPDSSVRIILNLSAPKGQSVNEGIDAAQFPAVMSSTSAWLDVLNKAGHGCWLSKVDFADAYKHVSVCAADTELQWFEWAGRYFKELCLIFGSASSAGILMISQKCYWT